MKFVIALVSYLESLGYDTSSLRKSADGSKAIVHMQYAEILSKNLDTNANVTIYDRVNPDFQALLASDEWNGNVTGTPNSFGDLAELAKYESRLTAQVTEAKTDMDNFQTEIAGEVTTAKEDLNAIVDNYQVTVNQQLEQTQQQFNQAVGAVTEDSEVVLARNEYPTLKERLDGEWDNVNAQLAGNTQQITGLQTQKADKTEINTLATEKADKTEVNTQISNMNNDISNIKINFPTKYTCSISGSYYAYSGWFNDDANGSRTDYIALVDNQVIEYSTKTASAAASLAFFDSSKVFMKSVSIQGSGSIQTGTIEIPTGAKFIILSAYSFTGAYMTIKNKDSFLTKNENDLNLQRIYSGGYNSFSMVRKFTVIGDSLSVGWIKDYISGEASGRNTDYSWGQYIARRYKSVCVNNGFSGATVQRWLADQTYGLGMLNKPENKSQVYIITLGANNMSDISTLGSPSTVNDPSTFYGAYQSIVNSIRNVNPLAKIMVCTFPTNYVDNETNWKAINDAIKWIAQNNGSDIFLVNLAAYNDIYKSYPMVNTEFYSHYMPLGYALQSYVIACALDKVILDNYRRFGNIHLIPYSN